MIPVYTAEKLDGLSEAISGSHSIAFSTKVEPIQDNEKIVNQLARAKNLFNSQSKTEDFDLFALQAILVTVGWNLNDDVFGHSVVWNAKDTPIHKPFNYEHKPDQNIGHIVACDAIDEDFQVISPDSELSDLPDKFHLLTSAVIYRQIVGKRNPEWAEKINTLIEEIEAGKWFVSMECLFSDFDYAIQQPDGFQHVVARNDDTAFLTKHLRFYGGSGAYENRKVGRYLKDVTFSGKGLVRKPANPESVVMANVSDFMPEDDTKNKYDIVKSSTKTFTYNGDINMSDNQNDVKLVEAQNEIRELRQRLADVEEEKVQKTISEKDEKIAELQKTVEAKDTEISNLEAAKKEALKSAEEIEASKKEVEEKLTKAKEQVASIEAESKKSERISSLVDVGIEKSEAEKVVQKFESVDDEVFAEIVETKSQLVAAKKEKDKDDKNKDDKKKKSKNGMPNNEGDAGQNSDDDDDKNSQASDNDDDSAQADLDDADPEQGASAGATADSHEDALGGLSDYLNQEISKKRRSK